MVNYNIYTFLNTFFSRNRLQVRPVDRCSRTVAQQNVESLKEVPFWSKNTVFLHLHPQNPQFSGTYNAKPMANTYSHNCTMDRATMLKFGRLFDLANYLEHT